MSVISHRFPCELEPRALTSFVVDTVRVCLTQVAIKLDMEFFSRIVAFALSLDMLPLLAATLRSSQDERLAIVIRELHCTPLSATVSTQTALPVPSAITHAREKADQFKAAITSACMSMGRQRTTKALEHKLQADERKSQRLRQEEEILRRRAQATRYDLQFDPLVGPRTVSRASRSSHGQHAVLRDVAGLVLSELQQQLVSVHLPHLERLQGWKEVQQALPQLRNLLEFGAKKQ